MSYSTIKRHTPVKKRRTHPETRTGKTGTIRLTGKALQVLRDACWERDGGICQICGWTLYKIPRFDGDPLAYDMAHIVSRGAGGSDTLDNVRCLCHRDHVLSHNCGGRPLSKSKVSNAT